MSSEASPDPAAAPSAPDPAAPAPSTPAEGDPAALLLAQVAFALAVVTGAVLRFLELGLKPLHHDEGVNGWFLERLLDQGLYCYDPTNYHGPFLYYAGALPLALSRSPIGLRLPQVLCAAALPLLLLPLRGALGWVAITGAAWLLAFSPTMVYFSRHAIHEIYFLTFTLAALVAFWRARERRAEWLAPTGGAAPAWGVHTRLVVIGVASLALVYANKETGVLTYACLGAGVALAALWARRAGERRPPLEEVRQVLREEWGQSAPGAPPGSLLVVTLGALVTFLALVLGISARAALLGPLSANAWEVATWLHDPEHARAWAGAWAVGSLGIGAVLIPRLWRACRPWWQAQPPARRGWYLGLAVAAALTVLLFSSLLTSPRGLAGLSISLYHWVARGLGGEKTGHEKPFAYYAWLIGRLDAPLLALALAGSAIALLRRRALELVLLGWAASTFLIYSVLTYKTPWLVINMLLPLALLGGVALQTLASAVGRRLGRERLVPAAGLLGALLCCAPNPGPEPTPPPREPTPRGVSTWLDVTRDLNYRGPDDARYLVVYEQTLRYAQEPIGILMSYAQQDVPILIATNHYWPIPFFLQGRPRVAYATFGSDGKPQLGDSPPPVILILQQDEAQFADQLEGWLRVPFQLRPSAALAIRVDPARAPAPESLPPAKPL